MEFYNYLKVFVITTVRMDPCSLHYSDDNIKSTFSNGVNNGHGLKTFRVNRCLPKPRNEYKSGCKPVVKSQSDVLCSVVGCDPGVFGAE